MLAAAGSGHLAGSLGIVDVMVALYFEAAKNDPKNPNWVERDRIVLSNGHVCPALYATLAHAGYFPVEELLTLRKLGSRLQGHPHRLALPGLETTSGPLGSGLGQACGMALAAKMDKKSWRVFCIASDGEHDEGNTWEAAMFAAKYKLGNLALIIDRNRIQISGNTENVMPLEPLIKKYEAFNWRVAETDGHDFESILDALDKMGDDAERPLCVIANTVAGKGIKSIEGDYKWHGRVPSQDEEIKFLEELKAEYFAAEAV